MTEPPTSLDGPDAFWGRGDGCWHLRWTGTLVIGVLALLALSVDTWVSDRFSGDHRPWRLVQSLTLVGAVFPVLLVLVVLSVFANRRRLYVGFLVPLLAHLPILHALKWAIGRLRPLAEQGAFAWQPFSSVQYADAFPSGHTTTATVFALLLATYLPRLRWVLYPWLCLVGAERVVTRMHFLSDVLTGYALGAAIVYTSVHCLGPSFYHPRLPVQQTADWQTADRRHKGSADAGA